MKKYIIIIITTILITFSIGIISIIPEYMKSQNNSVFYMGGGPLVENMGVKTSFLKYSLFVQDKILSYVIIGLIIGLAISLIYLIAKKVKAK